MSPTKCAISVWIGRPCHKSVFVPDVGAASAGSQYMCLSSKPSYMVVSIFISLRCCVWAVSICFCRPCHQSQYHATSVSHWCHQRWQSVLVLVVGSASVCKHCGVSVDNLYQSLMPPVLPISICISRPCRHPGYQCCYQFCAMRDGNDCISPPCRQCMLPAFCLYQSSMLPVFGNQYLYQSWVLSVLEVSICICRRCCQCRQSVFVFVAYATSVCISCLCCQYWQSVFISVVCVASVGNQCLYQLSGPPVLAVSLCISCLCCQYWQSVIVSVVHVASVGSLYLCQLSVIPVLEVSICISCLCCKCWQSVFVSDFSVASAGNLYLYQLSVPPVLVICICISFKCCQYWKSVSMDS